MLLARQLPGMVPLLISNTHAGKGVHSVAAPLCCPSTRNIAQTAAGRVICEWEGRKEGRKEENKICSSEQKLCFSIYSFPIKQSLFPNNQHAFCILIAFMIIGKQ